MSSWFGDVGVRSRAPAGPAGYLPLREAARRAGRSVRTVQRWVEEGRVETIPHPADRRRRLVAIVSLDHAVQRAAKSAVEPVAMQTEHEVDRAAVLAALRGLAKQAGLSAAGIGIMLRAHELPDEELLDSPFADRLQLLVGAVRGTRIEPPEVVQQALADVLLTLYSDPITRRIEVPDGFWIGTLIGRHVARAQLLLRPTAALVSLNEIVVSVGLPRSRVENMLQAIGVERLWDPDDERWLYPRHVITSVRSWDAGLSPPSEESDELREEPQASQGRTDPAAEEFPPTENRRELRAVRDAYHRRFLPVPRS